MSNDFIVKGSKELLLVAERMAFEKNISVESVIVALEDGIKMAAKKKYGSDLDIDCNIDRKTGEIFLYNKLEIVDLSDSEVEFNYKKHISLKDAKEKIKLGKAFIDEETTVEVGGFIKTELPPMDLSRIMVQIARNEIMRKVKDAESDREYEVFKDRIGTIISGVVKKLGIKNIVVEVDGYETLLHSDNLIPGEHFRTGDKVKAYISDVIRKDNDCQVVLSRIDPNFLVELLKQEVPEMNDGLIEVRGVVREAGSKAKVLVYSRDNLSDIIGVCVGPRGSRIQAVTNELRGEKIDVIKWSANLSELVANILTPANISKVIVNEIEDTIDVVVPQNQLSLAIGRNGQNIRLAVKLIKHKLNIMTDEEEKEQRIVKFNNATKLFVEELDVEEVIGQLLASDGYLSIESLANADIEDIAKIEGFDEEVAKEIQIRAREWVEENSSETKVEEVEEGKINEE